MDAVMLLLPIHVAEGDAAIGAGDHRAEHVGAAAIDEADLGGVDALLRISATVMWWRSAPGDPVPKVRPSGPSAGGCPAASIDPRRPNRVGDDFLAPFRSPPAPGETGDHDDVARAADDGAHQQAVGD
jgi:hypothetical protein